MAWTMGAETGQIARCVLGTRLRAFPDPPGCNLSTTPGNVAFDPLTRRTEARKLGNWPQEPRLH